MVNFKENYHLPRFQRGSNIFQGGGGVQLFPGGSNCLFPIETHITCDFPRGVRTPCPPLDPHLNFQVDISVFLYLGHQAIYSHSTVFLSRYFQYLYAVMRDETISFTVMWRNAWFQPQSSPVLLTQNFSNLYIPHPLLHPTTNSGPDV